MSISVNGTSVQKVMYNGTEVKQVYYGSSPAWAKRYSLSVSRLGESTDSVPASYIVRTTCTEPSAPVGGNPSGYCYHGETLETVLKQTTNGFVFPSGSYTVSGATSVYANNYLCGWDNTTMIKSGSEGSYDYYEFQFQNPYNHDRSSLYKAIPHPPYSGCTLNDHVKVYFQWVCVNSNSGSQVDIYDYDNAYGASYCILKGSNGSTIRPYFDSSIEGFYLTLRDLSTIGGSGTLYFRRYAGNQYEAQLRATIVVSYDTDYLTWTTFNDIGFCNRGGADACDALPKPWIPSTST